MNRGGRFNAGRETTDEIETTGSGDEEGWGHGKTAWVGRARMKKEGVEKPANGRCTVGGDGGRGRGVNLNSAL